MSAGGRDPQAESVSARLLALARASRVDYQVVLRRYILEQVLRLIDGSRYRDRFVLKGAFLFYVWGGEPFRTTQDLDLLGYGPLSAGEAGQVFRDILDTPQTPAWIRFETDSLRVGTIREDEQYEGISITVTATMGKSRIPVHIDIGTGDSIIPPPVKLSFKPLLGERSIGVRTYPAEAVIAEKLEAMVTLERFNSRMKDFYDMWILSRTKAFEGKLLSQSIHATFDRRKTSLPQTAPDCLSEGFFADSAKNTQWNGFLRRTRLFTTPPPFAELGNELRSFALPLLEKARMGDSPGTWPAGGPWQSPAIHTDMDMAGQQ